MADRVFVRLASLLPEGPSCVGLAVRRPEVRQRLASRWPVPAFSTAAELVAATSPDSMISAVTWDANPGIVESLVGAGMPVLCETPPAPDVDGMRALWRHEEIAIATVLEQMAVFSAGTGRLLTRSPTPARIICSDWR